MYNQISQIDDDSIQAFLKRNPEFKEKLNANIDEFSATKIEKDEIPAEKTLEDNELAEELWILKLEERTLLDTYINLITQVNKQQKVSDKKNNKILLVTLNKQVKKVLEQMTVIQTITIPLKRLIDFRKVSSDMKKMLGNVEKHIRKDRIFLNKMIGVIE